MGIFNIFKRYKLIKINDYNALYGAVNAAFTRLHFIKVARDKACHAVEKDEILSLLREARAILK